MAETSTTKAKAPRRRSASAADKAKPRAARRAPAAKKQQTGRGSAFGVLSIGAAVSVLAAGLFGLTRLARRAPSPGEHVPVDLMGNEHPDGSQRAPVDFRPDPTAAVPASERDQFRPALAGSQAPTLVAGQAKENERLNAMPS